MMDWIWKVIIFSLVVVIVFGLVLLIMNPTNPTPVTVRNAGDESNRQVSVYGAVKNPGTYEYKGNIRVSDVVELAGGLAENADSEFSNLSKRVNDGETIIIPTLGLFQPTLTSSVQEGTKINLNTADRNELMSLPGIGEKRADDIIELREKKGGFKRIEELLEIPGIGEKLLESIYDRLFIE